MTSLFRHVLQLLLALVLFTSPVPESNAAEANGPSTHPVTVEAIVSSWQSRQARVKSARIVWKHQWDGIEQFSRFRSTWVPDSEDLSREPPNVLLIDGGRMRYETSRWTDGEHGWSKENRSRATATVFAYFPERVQERYLVALSRQFHGSDLERKNPRQFVRVFDGATYRDLWKAEANKYPRGTLHAQRKPGNGVWVDLSADPPSPDEPDALDYFALLLAFRPLNEDMVPMRPERCSIVTGTSIVHGRECVVLRQGDVQQASSVDRRCWIDAARDCVILRYLASENDTGGIQIDVDYREDPEYGWVPCSWSAMRFDGTPGPVQQFLSAVVTTCSLDTPISPDAFHLVFPRGSWVVDKQAGGQYLIRDDGSRRITTENELKSLPTYEELMASKSGLVTQWIEACERRKALWRSLRWPLFVAGIAAVFLAFVVILRTRLGRSNQ